MAGPLISVWFARRAVSPTICRRSNPGLPGGRGFGVYRQPGDTNTLLHYQLPDSINWPKVVGHEQVRIVIPLRVVEELDAKKYSEGQKLRDRARALLPQLDAMISLMGSPTPLDFPTTTIEVPVEFASGMPRVKPVDVDEEILFTCRELWQLSGEEGGVTLITADIAMRIRAEALGGTRPIKLPDKYLREPASQ